MWAGHSAGPNGLVFLEGTHGWVVTKAKKSNYIYMSAIAGQTAGPKLFEGTFEYPWGNIGKKIDF